MLRLVEISIWTKVFDQLTSNQPSSTNHFFFLLIVISLVKFQYPLHLSRFQKFILDYNSATKYLQDMISVRFCICSFITCFWINFQINVNQRFGIDELHILYLKDSSWGKPNLFCRSIQEIHFLWFLCVYPSMESLMKNFEELSKDCSTRKYFLDVIMTHSKYSFFLSMLLLTFFKNMKLTERA